MMAPKLITSNRASRITIPAAAVSWKTCLWAPHPAQIWMGRAVKGASMPSGVNVTKVSAPTTINGAVSPIARPTLKIQPVRIAGSAEGRTTCRTTCQQ